MPDHAPFDDLRAALAKGRHDAQLLDGRDFDRRPWDKADRGLEAMEAVVDTAADTWCGGWSSQSE